MNGESAFKLEMSLGHLLTIIAIVGSVGAGIWQGGMIRASLEANLTMERSLRESGEARVSVQLSGLADGLRQVQTDVREMRVLAFHPKGQ